MPKVLVAIPTFNRPEFVRDAVASVQGQSFGDWRILISDNASRIEVSQSVQAHVAALADPRIEYFRQPRNIREYGNCCWLFEQCREEFFVILHDDDMLDPGHLAAAIARLRESARCSAYLADAMQVNPEGIESPERTAGYRRARGRSGLKPGPMRMLEPLLATGFVSISGTVFRRAALLAAGFVDEDCFGLWPFELNVLLRLGQAGAEIWFEPKASLRYRFHEGQMQRYQGIAADPVAVAMVLNILDRRRFDGRAERLRRRLCSMFLHMQARIAVRKGDLAGCRRSLARAIRVNPWWIRHWPLAACAFLFPPLTAGLVRHIDARPAREL